MEWTTIHEIVKSYNNGDYSPSELVAYYLDRIAKYDGSLHSYLSVYNDAALEQAKIAEKNIANDSARPLEGVPIALKDNMAMKGVVTTAGSKILEKYTATYTATAVRRLLDAGAIILGKTNMDEFAMGSSTEHSAYGPTKNPHDVTRVPGGSSGGSAAAVASDCSAAAIGSDTGGSIRQPASLCGVVGFKPTYGRISRYGLVAMASSLDQIGPITRSVSDAANLYAIMAGSDGMDATTSEKKVVVPKQDEKSIKGVRVGVPESFFEFGFDERVKKEFDERVKQMKEAGAKIISVNVPLAKMALPVYYLLVTSEVSSNLARFDGVRYGHRAQNAKTLIEQYVASRAEGLGEEAQRRILLGTFTLSAGYRDKYYKQATMVRDAIGKEFDGIFSKIDVIVSPTSPTVAFKLGEKFEDPLTMYLSDLFTVPANIANLPSISIPGGSADALPVGFQIMGARWDDARVLEVANACETIFGQGKPPIL